MFITSMRYGHGSKAIVGITLHPDTKARSAYRKHKSSKIVQDVVGMVDSCGERDIICHKAEKQNTSVQIVRLERIYGRSCKSVFILSTLLDHPAGMVNAIIGRSTPIIVDAQQTEELGKTQL